MLLGHVERLTARGVTGWAADDAAPGAAVILLVSIEGEAGERLLGRVLANRYRTDLETAGLGRGRHGFALDFEVALSPTVAHRVRVRAEADGAELPGSPCLLAAARQFDTDVQSVILQLLSQCGTEADLPRKIDFLATALDGLAQAVADADAGRIARAEHAELLRRWRGRAPGAVAPPAMAPRALVVGAAAPADEAGLAPLRALQGQGFAVTYAPADGAAPAAEAAFALAAAGIGCAAAPYYGSVEEVLRRQAGGFALVCLMGREMAARYGGLVRAHCPQARCVVAEPG